jgi:D-arabinose 1-dehydrogenase-like Zn-dependent alcohol dehydrogenase
MPRTFWATPLHKDTLGDSSMKCFRFKQTGEPLAVLTPEDAPTPTPGDDEVLVRVLLGPIHPSDLHVPPAESEWNVPGGV